MNACRSFRFILGETPIFFDEIQNFPEIETSFKFFCMDGRYDVIASGSLFENFVASSLVKSADGSAKSLKMLIASDKYPDICFGRNAAWRSSPCDFMNFAICSIICEKAF